MCPRRSSHSGASPPSRSRWAAPSSVKAPPGTPRLAIKLRAERLVQFGYRPVDVLEAIQAAFQGTIVAQTYQGSRVSNVAVILDDPERRDPETIGALLLRNANGLRLP